MTVSATSDRRTFACNGSTTVFVCNFRVLAATELVAYLITVATGEQAQLTYGVDYTVSGAGGTETTVTTAVAYSSAYQLKCRRVTQRLQLVDYLDNDPFPAETHEGALDRLTHIVQEQDTAISGSLRVAEGDSINELPGVESRANKLLSFDSGGQPVALAPTSGSASELAIQLAATDDATEGSGQVGYNPGLAYASGLGQFLNYKFGRTASEIAGSVTPTNYAYPPGDVRRYGAVGDGVTDDYAAFVAALAVMPAFGGEIQVPDGFDCLVETKIVLNRPIVLSGAGCAAVNNGPYGSRITKPASMAGPVIQITGNGAQVRDLCVQGVSGNTGDGIEVLGARVILHNVSVCGMGQDGVRVGSTSSSINANGFCFTSLRTKSNGRDGVRIDDKVYPTGPDANGSVVENLDTQDNGAAGYYLGNVFSVTCVGLLSQTNGTWGIEIYGAGGTGNTFIGGDVEGNTSGALYIRTGAANFQNQFVGVQLNGTVTDAGNLTVFVGCQDGGVGDVAGLQLPNVTSTRADVLDYYSRGTFTPTITFATPGDLAVTYSAQVGKWQRIGNKVTVSVSIMTSSFTHTTASGNLRISTLPFTAANTANLFGLGPVWYRGITRASTPSIVARTSPNTTYLVLAASGSGATNGIVDASDMPTGGAVVIVAQCDYWVA